MVGYVAGQPFPLIDANDPFVAEKVIWNNVFRPIQSDDYDLRYFDCQSEYIRPGKEQEIIDNIDVGHYAGYNLVGRTGGGAVTGRSRLQKDWPVLAVRALPGARATGCARPGNHSLPLRRSKTRRRQLGLEFRQPPRAPPERGPPEHRDGHSDLRPDHYSGFNPKPSSTSATFWARTRCSPRCTLLILPR